MLNLPALSPPTPHFTNEDIKLRNFPLHNWKKINYMLWFIARKGFFILKKGMNSVWPLILTESSDILVCLTRGKLFFMFDEYFSYFVELASTAS